MLYSIGRDLESALAAKAVPFKVFYGPERAEPTTVVRERIVIERDRQGGDTFVARRSQSTNPKRPADRQVGARLRIFAQATSAGSMQHEHERRVDAVADRVFVALDGIIRGARRTSWRIESAKLLSADELQMRGLETWPGAVYEIVFSVDRGVFDTAWDGSAADEVTVGTDVTIVNQTTVSRAPNGAPESVP